MTKFINLSPPWGEQAYRDIIGLLNTGRSLQVAGAALAAQSVIMAQHAGRVNDISVVLNEAFAAGESMVLDVLKAPAGGGAAASILTATVTLNATSAVNAKISLMASLDLTKANFVPGEIFQIVRTYVAGGGPAAPANVASVELGV